MEGAKFLRDLVEFLNLRGEHHNDGKSAEELIIDYKSHLMSLTPTNYFIKKLNRLEEVALELGITIENGISGELIFWDDEKNETYCYSENGSNVRLTIFPESCEIEFRKVEY